jgi:hypothetical protein
MAPSSFAQTKAQAGTTQLHLVQKIYVGEMGNSDEAARFRLLLEEELTKKGFLVATQREGADAMLTGVLSLRVYADTSVARATVRLKSSSDDLLWSGDFQPRSALFKRVRDTVRFRAQNIAEKLRNDWKKSAKAAGIKVK